MIINLPILGVWLTDLSGEGIRLRGKAPRPAEVDDADSDVRDYAGRRRIIGSARRSAGLTLTLMHVTGDQLAQLRDWKGVPLLLRSDVWRRWGTYRRVTATPEGGTHHPSVWGWRVTVEWVDVDHDEAV